MRAAAKWVQPEHHKVVGAALAAARRKANLTQVELARRLAKPQSVVSGYEAGKRRVDGIPPPGAVFLGCPISPSLEGPWSV
jgi:DNA-binding transcriptional regulator YiaG